MGRLNTFGLIAMGLGPPKARNVGGRCRGGKSA